MFIVYTDVSIIAKNKDRITLKNIYDLDVAVVFTWKNKSFPYVEQYQNQIIKTNQTVTFVAPLSTCYVGSISITPAKNLNVTSQDMMLLAGSAASAIGGVATISLGALSMCPPTIVTGASMVGLSTGLLLEIRKSKNRHTIHNIRNNTFFTIEPSHHNSEIKGQKKILVHHYTSQEQYEEDSIAVQKIIEEPSIL
jgi:hypothetical protein